MTKGAWNETEIFFRGSGSIIGATPIDEEILAEMRASEAEVEPSPPGAGNGSGGDAVEPMAVENRGDDGDEPFDAVLTRSRSLEGRSESAADDGFDEHEAMYAEEADAVHAKPMDDDSTYRQTRLDIGEVNE